MLRCYCIVLDTPDITHIGQIHLTQFEIVGFYCMDDVLSPGQINRLEKKNV